MARIAIIENGVVVNVIVADSAPNGVDVTGLSVSPGWLYDGVDFTPPPPPVTPPPPPAPLYSSYTVATFIEALTRDEALNFLATMKTDPLLEMWYELAKARGVIDFNDTDTLTNAPYLVQAGVVTQSRLDELTG